MKKNLLVFLSVSIVTIMLSTSSTSVVAFSNTNSHSQFDLLDSWEGYTLFPPEFCKDTYLINMDGEVVHTWDSDYIQCLVVYLLEDGSIIRNNLPGINPRFMGGGITGRVEIIDWYGPLIWEFEYFNSQVCLHHDFEVLPNGNILFIAWEYKSDNDAISQGRNPNKINLKQLWPDHVIEVEPTFPNGGNIVWEWHVWDHLIQDYDPSKANYGVVEDYPELIDINFGYNGPDWLHINSIDYNEEFDQIMLSVHHFNEIWIIDHSTTTTEAAGHTGGNSGKGGDILYRWGNPMSYHKGTFDDKKLFGQHDAQWIEPDCPGEGNILVFNNGQNRPNELYSSVDEIVPPVDENGKYNRLPDLPFGPEEQIWIYTAEHPNDFFSPAISGAQRCPNGNTLICEGADGYFFEVNNEKVTVWDYLNPYPLPLTNPVFKIRRYSPDYPGLEILAEYPERPSPPDGPTSGIEGVEYTYTCKTTDPQEDLIHYYFDWDDGTNSGWLGPYDSGDIVEASHVWSKKGYYNIRVKARDIHVHQSLWSDPLSVSMPRNKVLPNTFFLRLLERFPNAFPLLRHILGL